MAAGPVTVLNVALEKISGAIDLENDEFAVVLCGSDQALSAAFTGTSGEALYSDLTDEVAGTGYDPGGKPLANKTWSLTGAIASLAADPTAWDGLNATVKYAVICRATSGAPPADILAIVDLETTEPDGRVSTGGDFIINWSTALFTLTRAS